MTNLPLSPELLDTFRSLSVKKRQGVLEIVSPNREYELTFFEGKIIHADRIDQSFIQFLAEKVKSVSGLFSNELDSVGRGEQITRLLQLTELELPTLIEYKKAYDRQTLACLAEESSFSFDFRTKIVRCPEGLSLELSPGHYLLDLLEGKASAEEITQPPAPAETAKLTINTESVVSLEKPPVATVSTVPERAEPAVQVIVPTRVKRKRRKSRKPPKAGRFKVSAKKKKFAGALKLNPEQTLMGIKLTLLLLLSLFAPGFLSAWSQTLYSFLAL